MKVNFFAPINMLGYGIHSYNTIKTFEARGHHVCVIPPLGQVRFTDENVERWISARLQFDPDCPGVMIFNEEYLTQFCGRPRIGFPVFETEKFTALQLAGMRSCDYLFTPTQWGKNILLENGFENIFVVNEGFDPKIFHYIEISKSAQNDEPFTFVHVGKFEERKGTLQIIHCFFQALENECARLFMHVDNPFIQDYSEIERALQQIGFISTTPTGQIPLIFRRKSLSIQFTTASEKQNIVANLYHKADAAVFASRAEGWGLPILESIASGLPTIAGRWTGPTEYLPEENPFEIKIFSRKPAIDNQWFDGTRGQWNVPDDENLKTVILEAFLKGRQFRKTSVWKKIVEEARQFTWERAAEQMEGALREITGV